MLGRKKRSLENFSIVLDILAGSVILFGVYLFLFHFRDAWEKFLTTITGYPFFIQDVSHLAAEKWIFLVILFNLIASLHLNRFYQVSLFAQWPEVLFQSFKSVAIGVGMITVFFYFFSFEIVNRSLLFGFAGLFYLYHGIKELGLRRYLIRFYQRKPLEALLVCLPEELDARLAEFKKRQQSSVVIKAVVLAGESIEDIPVKWKDRVIGKLEDIADILSKGRFDLVFLVSSDTQKGRKIISAAEEQGVEVWYFTDFVSPLLARPEIDEFGGKPMIVYRTVSHYEGKFLVKRGSDIVLSLILLAFTSPIFLLTALLIKITTRGPVFYAQERTGWRGQVFRMLKFRTMLPGAEEQLDLLQSQNEMKGPVFKSGEDPRITPVGRFLRRFSLDELPQLWNVLKGQMSLVGPRPLPVYETENFEAFKDHRRYSVLPGLTGLWQVSGRSQIKDFSEWVRLDLEYIDKWSLWLDFVILIRTIPVVLRGEGAK